MEKTERQHEDHLKLHASNFKYEVQKLHDVAKEHHIFFVGEMKKVEESVNQKVEALMSEMSNKVSKMDQTHLSLHGKIDVIVDAIKKLMEYYTSFTTKFDTKTEADSKVVTKLE